MYGKRCAFPSLYINTFTLKKSGSRPTELTLVLKKSCMGIGELEVVSLLEFFGLRTSISFLEITRLDLDLARTKPS